MTANAPSTSGDGGFVDLTVNFNRQTTGDGALRANELATPPPSAADGMPASEFSNFKDSSRSTISVVRLDGLQGASQAMDVAMEPRFSLDATSAQEFNSGVRSDQPTELRMPFSIQSGKGNSPATPSSREQGPIQADGETTSLSTKSLPGASPDLRSSVSASAVRQFNHSISPSHKLLTVVETKFSQKEPNDGILQQIVASAKSLTTAVLLNDRHVQAAIMAVALATVSYSRWRRTSGGGK